MTTRLYAGIDEAGYGPMLGPLCVACTAFTVETTTPDPPDLWHVLSQAVCRSRRDRRGRVAVDDSKKLKGTKGAATHPLKHLERGVLGFLTAGGWLPSDAPVTDDALLQAVGGTRQMSPWYDAAITLPVAQDPATLRIAGDRIRRTMDRASVTFRGAVCDVIDVTDFNKKVDVMGRKSAVTMQSVLSLIDRVWRKWSDGDPVIVVDRQGGRVHYRQELAIAWPQVAIQIMQEDADASIYQLTLPNRGRIEIRFQPRAEGSHLPVALASMTAKYVRELLMGRLNAYFRAHLPELKPTAGYVEDGRRYVGEIEQVIVAQSLDRGALIRAR